MTFRPLAALVAKDLHVFLVDRYAVVLTILAPIALASFMAAIFGGGGPTNPSPVPIRLVDDDGSDTSKAIIAGALADRFLAAESSRREEAVASVRNGRAVAAVIIPEGFGDAASEAMLGSARPPELTFIVDPTHQSDLALARGTLTRLIFEAVASDALQADDGDGLLSNSIIPAPLGDSKQAEGPDEPNHRPEFLALFEGIERDRGGEDPDLELDRAEFRKTFPGLKDWFPNEANGSNPVPSASTASPKKSSNLAVPYTTRDQSITSGENGDRAALAGHAFAGMAVQFVLFSATEWGVGLLRERRKGLWKRLRSAPISRHTLMASKAVGCTFLSISVILIVFGFGAITFGFGIRGSVLGFGLVAFGYAFTASTFGLLVASLGRSPEGARAVSILAVLVMTMLGGGWIPSFLFPAWLQKITPAIPTRWAIDGFDGVISRGFTLTETLPAVAALLGFGAAFSIVAVVAHRWDEA